MISWILSVRHFPRPQGGVPDSITLAFYFGSHSPFLQNLTGGRWRGGLWCLLDTFFSPGFLEEPKKSSSSSGSDCLISEGTVSRLSQGEAFILSEDHQILFPSDSQLLSGLKFPKPDGDQSLPLSPWEIHSLPNSVFRSCEMGTWTAIPVTSRITGKSCV